jgi:hypothetical protein
MTNYADQTIGYDPETITETTRGFSYDVEKLEELGWVTRNGVRLLYDRQHDELEVTRTDPALEDLVDELQAIATEWKQDQRAVVDGGLRARNQTLVECAERIESALASYE